MAAKAFLVLASALFAQSISAACIGNSLGNSRGLSYSGLNGGCGCGSNLGGIGYSNGRNSVGYSNGYSAGYGNNVAVASGGGLPVSISSPIAPSGISIYSENSIEGLMDICGALPVLAAVAFDANLPTSGTAGVQYGCGNGNVGITSADSSSGLSGIGSAGYSSGLAGAGSYGLGRGSGCGCGSRY